MKNRNRQLMLGKKVNAGGYYEGSNISATDPVVYTGIAPIKNTYMFSDDFSSETISKLILDLESIRQSGSYTEVDLYFTSVGGSVDELFNLANYLDRNLDDTFKLNIIVNGGVFSAGLYILLLMVNNPYVDISIGETAMGMVHLGSCSISYYGTLRNEYHNKDWDSFLKQDLDRINSDVFMPMINRLGLEEHELNEISSGGSIYLGASRLREALNRYADVEYIEEGLEEDLAEIDNVIEQYKKAKDELLSMKVD